MASSDQTNQPFDQRLEFRAGLAVVFVGVQRTYFLDLRAGVEATEAAFDADDDGRRDTIDGKTRPRLRPVAHRARRDTLRRVSG